MDGRKRHILIDSMGLLLAVSVTAANVDNAQAARELFSRLDGQPTSRIQRMFADGSIGVAPAFRTLPAAETRHWEVDVSVELLVRRCLPGFQPTVTLEALNASANAMGLSQTVVTRVVQTYPDKVEEFGKRGDGPPMTREEADELIAAL